MDKKLVVLEYQDNFADNFSTYAYGKILENKFSHSCVYENTTSKREEFEDKMNNFHLSYSYISKSRVNKITSKSKYLDYRDIYSKKINNDKIVSMQQFRIDDIDYLNNDIKSALNFDNNNFIKNYDILEEIEKTNSIGLYINPKDSADITYIKNAIMRINKYIKKPVLYIFSKNIDKIDVDINYKILKLYDWREEFYFLKSCRHKIIHCSKNSYSEGFWAALLAKNNLGYITYDKILNPNKKFKNWIAI